MEKLSALKEVNSRKMFGGYGVFHEKKMFGIIDSKGNIFLKAKEDSVEKFLEANSEKHSRMPYYTIPSQIMDDNKTLITWVKKSIAESKD